jgi:hypothetical protein
LHDDDLIDDDFVSTCLQTANFSKDFGFIRTGTRMIGENGNILRDELNCAYSNSPDKMFLAWINNKSTPYLCSTLFNTRALKRIGGLKSKNNLFEDGFAIIKLSDQYPILNIVDMKASFRSHEEQRTHAANPLKWSEDFRLALDMIYLQDPNGRKELYEKGMRLFAKTSIEFAMKVKNPLKRLISVILVAKYFPHYYWHRPPKQTLKFKIAKNIGKLIFYHKKGLSG